MATTVAKKGFFFINRRLKGITPKYKSMRFGYRDFDDEDWPLISDDIIIHDKYREGFDKYRHRTDLTLEERVYTLYGIGLVRLNKPIDVAKYSEKVASICLADTSAQPIGTNEQLMTFHAESDFLMVPRMTRDNPLLTQTTDQNVKDVYNRLSFADRSVTNQTDDCQVINRHM